LQNIWNTFVLTFVPLFIVIDAMGNLPIVMTLSEGMTDRERSRMVNVAMLTATGVGLVFLFFGQFILNVLNIPVGALTVAGGIILFTLSIRYVLSGRWVQYEGASKEEMIAVVPIGTPLVVGPATITTLLLLVNSYHYDLWIVLVSLALNLLISYLVFLAGYRIIRFLGKGGLKAVSQIFNLLIAAIAVNMVIRGLGLIGVIKLG
jgi:multiple antibiotic resistance protein